MTTTEQPPTFAEAVGAERIQAEPKWLVRCCNVHFLHITSASSEAFGIHRKIALFQLCGGSSGRAKGSTCP